MPWTTPPDRLDRCGTVGATRTEVAVKAFAKRVVLWVVTVPMTAVALVTLAIAMALLEVTDE